MHDSQTSPSLSQRNSQEPICVHHTDEFVRRTWMRNHHGEHAVPIPAITSISSATRQIAIKISFPTPRARLNPLWKRQKHAPVAKGPRRARQNIKGDLRTPRSPTRKSGYERPRKGGPTVSFQDPCSSRKAKQGIMLGVEQLPCTTTVKALRADR